MTDDLVFVALAVCGSDTKIVGVFSEYWLASAAANVECEGYEEGKSVPVVQKWEVDACGSSGA